MDDPLAESEMSEDDSELESEESIDLSSNVSELVKKKKSNWADTAYLNDDPKTHNCWKSWLKCRDREWINDEAQYAGDPILVPFVKNANGSITLFPDEKNQSRDL